MEFEKKVTLFLATEELTTEVKQFLRSYNIDMIELNKTEGIVSIQMIGRYIRLSFIFELEDALDKRITICTRYIGSAETIKSLGLD